MATCVVTLLWSFYIRYSVLRFGDHHDSLDALKEREAQVRTLNIFIKEKDVEVRSLRDSLHTSKVRTSDLEATVANLQTVLKDQVRDARERGAERIALEAQLKERSRDLERLRTQEAASRRQAIEDLRACEDDRTMLFADLNASRMLTSDLDATLGTVLDCCESVPMCNLCRMRR